MRVRRFGHNGGRGGLGGNGFHRRARFGGAGAGWRRLIFRQGLAGGEAWLLEMPVLGHILRRGLDNRAGSGDTGRAHRRFNRLGYHRVRRCRGLCNRLGLSSGLIDHYGGRGQLGHAGGRPCGLWLAACC